MRGTIISSMPCYSESNCSFVKWQVPDRPQPNVGVVRHFVRGQFMRFAVIFGALSCTCFTAQAAGTIYDRFSQDRNSPTVVAHEPYETVEGQSNEPKAYVNPQGQPLIRYQMEEGSLRANLDQMMRPHGWRVVWNKVPDCIDWNVVSPYIVQAPTLEKLASASLSGLPLQTDLHIPNRVMSVRPQGHFSEDCQ